MIGVVFAAVFTHTAVAFFTDIRTRTIPNKWNMSILLCGIGFHLIAGAWNGLFYALAGTAAMLALTSLLYGIGAIGGGDVKWFAALGAWTGWSFSMLTLTYTLVIAGGIALLIFIYQRSIFAILQRWGLTIWHSLVLRSSTPLLEAARKPMKEIPLMLAALPAVLAVIWFKGVGEAYEALYQWS